METMTNTNRSKQSNDATDLFFRVNEFYSKLEKFIEDETYKSNGVTLNKYELSNEVLNVDLKDIEAMTLNQRKKLKRRLNKAKGMSVRSINMLLHFISTNVLKTKDRVRLTSEKHDRIQIARKSWIKVRNEADKLLAEYKAEKGDFYK